MLLAFWTSSALSSAIRVADRGPGWFCARVSTMNRWFGGTSSPVFGLAVRAEGDQRVVGLQRHEDGAAALHGLVDTVVEELAEEGEQRVVRRRQADVGGDVRDEQRLVRRHAAAGNAVDRRDGRRVGVGRAREHPGLPWVRTGNAAAAIAAGLVEVWSTIRLLTVRGCESTTKPFFCA